MKIMMKLNEKKKKIGHLDVEPHALIDLDLTFPIVLPFSNHLNHPILSSPHD